MSSSSRQGAIRVAVAADGALHYAIPGRPEALPTVTPQALSLAWDAARAAAAAEAWGPHRTLVFEGGPVLALADADAACWAEAVDRAVGLENLSGLALCLRLLALVELLGRAAWMRGLFAIGAEGIELHPALLGAAASQPLDGGARFDETAMKRLLSHRLAGATGAEGGRIGPGRGAPG
ncbi:hypothetical protein [Pseudoroseomonas cervicalis]|uniref:hypothetical protein n=1 Tax=Teichococcus cervicalis TaxID=204525 RepID=UPI0022F1CB5E|nr:hypothetical protein [Pseudoroseomonas cervicalis]WBV41385.1 hypothetical protein PFY06_08945 [Pseudoroseomonas cervicalis]